MDLIHSLGTWGFWLASYLVPFLFVLAVIVFFTNSDTSWSRDGAGFGLSRSLVGFGPELIGYTDRTRDTLEGLRHSAWRLRQISG